MFALSCNWGQNRICPLVFTARLSERLMFFDSVSWHLENVPQEVKILLFAWCSVAAACLVASGCSVKRVGRGTEGLRKEIE